MFDLLLIVITTVQQNVRGLSKCLTVKKTSDYSPLICISVLKCDNNNNNNLWKILMEFTDNDFKLYQYVL